MDFTFTPSDKQQKLGVPFLEDARSEYAPYYASGKSVTSARQEVEQALSQLGAGLLAFQEGYFGTKPKRYGYVILFTYQGTRGRTSVAGLPMRGEETPKKIQQARVQALLNVRDWLRASITQPVFSPGGDPLLQFLLVDGKRTLAEHIRESGRLALPGDVIDGEFEEDR